MFLCIFYILTKHRGFSAQMFLGSPDRRVRGSLVHEYSLLSVKTRDKQSINVNTFFFFFVFNRKNIRKKCIIDKNIKGHFVILVLCLVSLHKYCYSTAPIQGPGNSCVYVPPLERTTGRSTNAENNDFIIAAIPSVPLLCH